MPAADGGSGDADTRPGADGKNMNTTTANDDRTGPRARRQPTRGDAWLALLLAALPALAWLAARSGMFQPGDDLGYWLGVAGGTMMLALLLYPLRKHWRVMHRLGRVKAWFWMHMLFGLFGPWLILVHSTFHVGSLNAGVALYSMLIVVASGIVGRFIYVRVHRGLDGERTSLRELQARAGFVESEARSRLAFAPVVEAALRDFEQRELDAPPGLATPLRRVLWLPLQQWRMRLRCNAALDTRLRTLSAERGWDAGELARRRRHARKLVARYLVAVVRVAQFSAYERVFALWHVAHMPFVVLMVISAVVHVVAVHAY